MERPGNDNSDARNTGAPSSDVGTVAVRIIERLVHRFPVCMASDEFHFFPQGRAEEPDWSRWDDFSRKSMSELAADNRGWQEALDRFVKTGPDSDQSIDADILKRVLSTVTEQLTVVRPQASQPTFYLTVVGIGLSEALEHGPDAFAKRLRSLPGFLSQARDTLQTIPALFGCMGLAMLEKQGRWLESLRPPSELLNPVMQAFSDLKKHLGNCPKTESFLPDSDLYEHIAFAHMGCRMSPEEIADSFRAEIEETLEILNSEAERISPGTPWQKVLAQQPMPEPPLGGVFEAYRQIIGQLSRHCVEIKCVSPESAAAWPVQVEAIPDYMRLVRSNAAFAASCGHPPQGGTFYILDDGESGGLYADYRILSAHETWPGHHLLDSRRWNHERIARRHVEFPVFYEGWASFAEELLFDTGFFHSRIDRMLLAKRRFWRAMRGRVDFEIHTRRRTPEQAVDLLVQNGMDRDDATAMVNRYALKPGYQLAYTIGRRRFRRIYEQFLKTDREASDFVRHAPAHGEIAFDALARILANEVGS